MSQRSIGDGSQGGDGIWKSVIDYRNSNAFYVDLGDGNGSRLSSDFFWNNTFETAQRKENSLRLVNILN